MKTMIKKLDNLKIEKEKDKVDTILSMRNLND